MGMNDAHHLQTQDHLRTEQTWRFAFRHDGYRLALMQAAPKKYAPFCFDVANTIPGQGQGQFESDSATTLHEGATQ